jgi:lipid-A-disaccharide synthase-like uncharacterized protein
MLANWFFSDLFNWLGLFGLAGQFAFMMRFVVQWFASERRGRSYVPVAFWYLSLCGGAMLFSYALMRRDPVIMLGQALGMTIYIRNLVLIYGRRWRYQRRRLANQQEARADLRFAAGNVDEPKEAPAGASASR